MKIRNVKDVAAWRMCVGCGVCAYICPENNIKLIDIIADGIRPILESNNCGNCNECLEVCPGYETAHRSFDNISGLIQELKAGWGPVLETYEGYATDSEIRFNGSSGGAASAIALYCLEKEGMHGVLHTDADPEWSWKNTTVFSRDRKDLLKRTGSRYSPASPCNSLDQIEYAPSPCVFIGKPCDVAGLRKAQTLKAKLDQKAGIAIGIFCAGTPSTQGTLDFLERLKVNPQDVEKIRYRGKGWPGMATVRKKGQDSQSYQISYKESWDFLQKYRPYRCYLCPDGTSEFADISCGDPWYREIKKEESGYSLVLVRTERGRKILHRAMKFGYIHLKPAISGILIESQKNLLSKRMAILGRLMAMKVFGIPTPKLEGFHLLKNWLFLQKKEKVRSIFGTGRRIIQRKFFIPIKYNK